MTLLDDHAAEVERVVDGRACARCAYQPIVRLDTLQVVGFEALARFGPAARLPQPFLQVADLLDCRAALEAHLLTVALSALPLMPTGCFLAVNVTPALLSTTPVRSALRNAGSLAGVVLELTEQLPMGDLTCLRKSLDALQEQGARIALDDVGAGWCGLQQVVALRPDIIKLDRSLVQDVDANAGKRAVVELLADLMNKVGGQLLAEGIETAEELACVFDAGAHLGQGWLLGIPQLTSPSLTRPKGLRGQSEVTRSSHRTPWGPSART